MHGPALAVAALLQAVVSAGQQRFGLTTYGEPCLDSCQQRGFPYAWCHKKPSWNGTYLSMTPCAAAAIYIIFGEGGYSHLLLL